MKKIIDDISVKANITTNIEISKDRIRNSNVTTTNDLLYLIFVTVE